MFSAENVEGHLEVIRGQIAKPAWIHMTRLLIFWYMIELCVPYRGNQLSLQSDTRFSSYKGSKVGFDTFLAITLCVYIEAYNNFKTECTSSRGTFLIKNVMPSKVIRGRLLAKRRICSFWEIWSKEKKVCQYFNIW